MSVAESRWDGRPVQILRAGVVETVTYRHAVSLVSRGIAVWHALKTEKQKTQKPRPAPQSAPVTPGKTTTDAEVPAMVAVPAETIDKFRLVSEKGPEIVNLPKGSIVSAPTSTVGAEGDQAGYEPPLPDL